MNTAVNSPLNITLIGCGKMGNALMQGWIKAELIDRAFIIDPSPLPEDFAQDPYIQGFQNLNDYAAEKPAPDMVVLAVKPQIMTEVCDELKNIISPETPLLSIAAGRTLTGLSSLFAPEQPIIRAMPNTPAAIGQGMTAMVANAHITAAQKDSATRLMNATGQTIWLEDESLMDAVTALSGSGPAYIFLLIDILARAGETQGLPADQAMALARQTVIGASALAAADSASPAATLRRNVTSPGGTTEAALKVLMNGKLEEIFDEALKAAAARSRELAQ